MKKAILMIALASVSVCGFAQGKPAAKKEISCAVMKGDMVNIKEATASKMYTDYKGRRYFFCCKSCLPAFKKNPEKYAKNDSIPAPKGK
ncbi:MAG TPA: YHS domain-containing protein [Fimbriimonadaceae bacterium]|nr:YHS domain-containing protein [Fimbriimonadaceae bacterium]